MSEIETVEIVAAHRHNDSRNMDSFNLDYSAASAQNG